MVAVTSLLVLVCAVAINALALSLGDYRTTAIIGNPTGKVVHMKDVDLQPGSADWTVDIPINGLCDLGVNGETAVVTDDDVPPSVTFDGFSKLFVHRNGNLQSISRVQITVYCKLNLANVSLGKPQGLAALSVVPRV